MDKNTSVFSDEVFNLWFLLHMTRDAIHRARERELEQYGISAPQSAVLFFIQAISESGKDVTPAEISRWFFREANSINGILNRMEKAGLITKSKDLHKKNLIRVAMTPKGRQVYQQTIKREALRNTLARALTSEQRHQLWELLSALRDGALKECGIDYALPFPPPKP